jgi:hypothetical protein
MQYNYRILYFYYTFKYWPFIHIQLVPYLAILFELKVRNSPKNKDEPILISDELITLN